MKVILILIASLYQVSFADNLPNHNTLQSLNKETTEVTTPQNTNGFLDIGTSNLPRIKTETSVQLPQIDFELTKESQSTAEESKKQADPANSSNQQTVSNTNNVTDNISSPVSPATETVSTPTTNNQAEAQKQEASTTTEPTLESSKQTPATSSPNVSTPVSPATETVSTPTNNNQAEAQKQEANTTTEPTLEPSKQTPATSSPNVSTPVSPATEAVSKPITNNQAEAQKQEANTTTEPILESSKQTPASSPSASVADIDNIQSSAISKDVTTTQSQYDKSIIPENTKTSQKIKLKNIKKQKSAQNEKQKHIVKHVLTYPDPEFFDSETNYLLSQQYEDFDNKVNYDEYLENLPYIDYITKFWNAFMTKKDIKQAQDIQKYLNNYERFSSKKNILNP